MLIKSIFIALLLSLFGCATFSEKEVIITKNYVINPNLEEANNFDICRMKLRDSSKYVDINTVRSNEINNLLERDTSFWYVSMVKRNDEGYKKRKIYFNRNNGFVWHKWPHLPRNRGKSTFVLGSLEKETWYLLEFGDNFGTLYFIYLNSDNILHKVIVPPSAYTNF